jgi:hypothetical protein
MAGRGWRGYGRRRSTGGPQLIINPPSEQPVELPPFIVEECAGEPDLVVSPDIPTSLEVRVDCAADGRTLGPLRGRALTTRRILVPEDMELRVNFIDEDGFGVARRISGADV